MKWPNNSIYLVGTVKATGAIPHQLALLRDIKKDVTQQASNLQPITPAFSFNGCQDYDVTPDNQQLVCSAYNQIGPPTTPGAIMMRPISGSTFHSIYSQPPGGRIFTRAISNSTLIFILEQPDRAPSLWKINTNGSGLTQLLTTSSSDLDLGFAYASYLPWSLTSSDGNRCVLSISNPLGNTQSLVFGSLSGATAKTFASDTNSLLLAGWAKV